MTEKSAGAYNIEIISLIYCNTDYLKMTVKELKKVQKENPQIDVGIRVVANDANKKVIKKLKKLDIPYTIYNDKNPGEYYINRVYRCYNHAVKTSKYDNVCLVNSDMCFAKNWLQNLLKHHDGVNIPVSRLVESGKMPSGKYGVSLNCGIHPNCMDFEKWQKVSDEMVFNNKDVVKEGGLYMPCIFETKRFIEAGGYPEGNIYSGGIGASSGEFIKSGDDYFFHNVLEKKFNMKHITVFDSLCYHIQEGERDEDFGVKFKKFKNKIKKVLFSKEKKGSKRTIRVFGIKISYRKKIKGWLVNDCLTCIKGTKTFWHDILENIEGLEDKTNGYTDFKKLAGRIEKKLFLSKIIPWVKKPDYIIRNATFFRPIKSKVPQICLLQDFYDEKRFLDEQLPVLKSCRKTVINSNYIFKKAEKLLPKSLDVTVIPMGVDSDFFNPDKVDRNNMFEGVKKIKENSILFIGSNQDWPKGFNLLLDVVNKTNYNFVFVMKYDFEFNHPRVTVFNKLNQKDLRDVMASCKMVLCTSKMETFHLAGVESMLMNLPCVATNVGVYVDFEDGKWGVKCTEDNIIERIDYVFGRNDFSPRKFILEKGLDKKHTMAAWRALVDEVVKR